MLKLFLQGEMVLTPCSQQRHNLIQVHITFYIEHFCTIFVSEIKPGQIIYQFLEIPLRLLIIVKVVSFQNLIFILLHNHVIHIMCLSFSIQLFQFVMLASGHRECF